MSGDKKLISRVNITNMATLDDVALIRDAIQSDPQLECDVLLKHGRIHIYRE